MIQVARQKTDGAVMHIFCMGIGSTKSINQHHMI
jgi:hypothetical protein